MALTMMLSSNNFFSDLSLILDNVTHIIKQAPQRVAGL